MDMTPWRRTVLAMLLVGIPWGMVVLFGVALLMRSHVEGMKYTLGMQVSIIVGGVMCLIALFVCADGVRKKQANPLLYIFALAGFWYLVEWPANALLAVLRS